MLFIILCEFILVLARQRNDEREYLHSDTISINNFIMNGKYLGSLNGNQ